MKKAVDEFKDFITTGNLIAIAIGLLMAVAISAVVTSLTNNIINPIFAMFGGKPNFDEVLILTVNNAEFRLGAFFGAVVNFLIVALIAFIIVKISTKVLPPKESGPTEVELLTEIRDSLKK